ncbi:MAG: DUF4157 domain-containing protein [Anaerolineales bacterium]|nr:DUF4157 domain-containing protein [Anaerolineales bacterium]
MGKQKQTTDVQPAKQIKAIPAAQTGGVLDTAVNPLHSLQRAYVDPSTLTPANAQILQRTIGNQALGQLTIQRKMIAGSVSEKYEQKADTVDKQVVNQLAGSAQLTAQRQNKEAVEMKRVTAVQSRAFTSSNDIFFRQGKHNPNNNGGQALITHELPYMAQQSQAAQLQSMADNYSVQQHRLIQNKGNNTGLPDNLKKGMENLSGMSLDDVNVHRNSEKPAQLQAHAYAQGTEIHLGPGQEKHLPHEAWHVVQQKQGRVKPTMQMKGGVNVNDDNELEKEADLMGEKALQMRNSEKSELQVPVHFPTVQQFALPTIIQRKTSITHTYSYITPDIGDKETNYKVGRKVVAKLDPDDPIKGSSTGAHWDWMGPMREKYGKLVKGHLLNHDLGGFAKEENLYPITSKANHEHSAKVEQNVKRELFQRPYDEKRRLHYEVTVNEQTAHDPTHAQFHCWWGWERGYVLPAEKLGEETIDSIMQPGGKYGGFQGLPNNRFPMSGGNLTAANWYHESRAEERPEVNQDWAEHQKGWPNSKISVWGAMDTYGTFGNIKDAEKTSVNKLPAMEKGLDVAMELLKEHQKSINRQIDAQGFDRYFAKSFKESLHTDFYITLRVGEGKAKRISDYISKNDIYALDNKLKDIIEDICPDVIKVIKDAESQIEQRWINKAYRHPNNAFVKEYWDDEDYRIVHSAKLDIIDIIEVAVDQVGW